MLFIQSQIAWSIKSISGIRHVNELHIAARVRISVTPRIFPPRPGIIRSFQRKRIAARLIFNGGGGEDMHVHKTRAAAVFLGQFASSSSSSSRVTQNNRPIHRGLIEHRERVRSTCFVARDLRTWCLRVLFVYSFRRRFAMRCGLWFLRRKCLDILEIRLNAQRS